MRLLRTGRYVLLSGLVLLIAHVGWLIAERGTPHPILPPAGEVIAGKAPLTFAVVGDTHCHTAVLDQMAEQAKQEGTMFVVHVGDLTDHGDARGYEWVLHELAESASKLPFCPVPGNHDCADKTPNAKERYAMYSNAFGPREYWFACDNALFVALDDSTRSVQPADVEWLDETLGRLRAQYKACFVFMHVPLGHAPTPTRPGPKDRGDLLAEILNKWNVTAVFCGHIHTYIQDTIGNVPRYISGGGGGRLEVPGESHHYLLCRVGTDGRLTVEKKNVAASDADWLERGMWWACWGNKTLVAAAALVGLGVMLMWRASRRKSFASGSAPG